MSKAIEFVIINAVFLAFMFFLYNIPLSIGASYLTVLIVIVAVVQFVWNLNYFFKE